MSKATISATQTLAILTDVIYKTGGIVPVTKAATGGIPTPIKEQVATAPVTSAPVHIKAEAREPPVARMKICWNFIKAGATLPNSAHGVSLARNNSDTMVTGITSRSHQSTSCVTFAWTSSKVYINQPCIGMLILCTTTHGRRWLRM